MTSPDEFNKWMCKRPSENDKDWVAQFITWCINVPNADMLHFHHSEWIDYVKPILYSEALFNPIRSNRTFVFANNKVKSHLLPNEKYRSLLLDLVLLVPCTQQCELGVLSSMLMAMEENNITGFVHVPHIEPFDEILSDVESIYEECCVKLDRGYVFMKNCKVKSTSGYLFKKNWKVESTLLSNTSVVFVINSKLKLQGDR
jgi:hypothetical protein